MMEEERCVRFPFGGEVRKAGAQRREVGISKRPGARGPYWARPGPMG